MNEQNDKKLLSSTKILKAINEALIIAVTDATGRIISVNDQFCAISQYAKEELIGENHSKISSGYHTKEFFEDMWHTLLERKTWSGEMCDRAKDGSIFWLKTTIIPSYDQLKNQVHYITIRTDITDRKNMPHLKKSHTLDTLTHLGNGRSLDMYFNKTLALEGPETISGVIVLNLSRLKAINERFGHATGDLFILDVVKKIQFILSENDRIFRYKGKKLVITTNEFKVAFIIQQILAIFNRPFLIEDHPFYSNVHIGVAIFSKNGLSIQQLLQNAELALIEAKKETGNNVLYFQESMTTIFVEQLDLEKRLRTAIHTNQLMLYYQPKFETKTHQLIGMEALLRWYDADYGFIPPDKFLPIAEQSGFMPLIDEWVLKTAAAQMKQWLTKFPKLKLRVAVNVSPLRIQEDDFIYIIEDILHEVALPAKFLEIEITENSFIHKSDTVLKTILALKRSGISIAIDDFGTGYSSLGYLKQFPIDTIKIDKSFIRGIKRNSKDASMVQAIIHLAHIMNMDVVVEGVETLEELTIISLANGDMIQGYYFSPALSVENFTELLRATYNSLYRK